VPGISGMLSLQILRRQSPATDLCAVTTSNVPRKSSTASTCCRSTGQQVMHQAVRHLVMQGHCAFVVDF